MALNRAPLAEIRLRAPRIRFFGALAQHGAQGAAIRLLTIPLQPEMLAPGVEVELAGEHEGAAFAEPAVITESQGDRVVLSYRRQAGLPPQGGKPPTLPTMPCELAAQYRVVRRDGRMGAWRSGTVVGICSDGVQMTLEAHAERTAQIEVRFYLPIEGLGGAAGTATPAGAGLQAAPEGSRPVRATARALGWRLRGPSVEVAAAFAAITPADRNRIVLSLGGQERAAA